MKNPSNEAAPLPLGAQVPKRTEKPATNCPFAGERRATVTLTIDAKSLRVLREALALYISSQDMNSPVGLCPKTLFASALDSLIRASASVLTACWYVFPALYRSTVPTNVSKRRITYPTNIYVCWVAALSISEGCVVDIAITVLIIAAILIGIAAIMESLRRLRNIRKQEQAKRVRRILFTRYEKAKETKMKRQIRNVAIALLIIAAVIVVWGSGYRTGQVDERAFTLGCEPGLVSGPCVEDAKQAEYTRVVAAIARTMRCSTEEEHKAGRDHECDPSEITQDAGLTNADGNQIASR